MASRIRIYLYLPEMGFVGPGGKIFKPEEDKKKLDRLFELGRTLDIDYAKYEEGFSKFPLSAGKRFLGVFFPYFLLGGLIVQNFKTPEAVAGYAVGGVVVGTIAAKKVFKEEWEKVKGKREKLKKTQEEIEKEYLNFSKAKKYLSLKERGTIDKRSEVVDFIRELRIFNRRKLEDLEKQKYKAVEYVYELLDNKYGPYVAEVAKKAILSPGLVLDLRKEDNPLGKRVGKLYEIATVTVRNRRYRIPVVAISPAYVGGMILPDRIGVERVFVSSEPTEGPLMGMGFDSSVASGGWTTALAKLPGSYRLDRKNAGSIALLSGSIYGAVERLNRSIWRETYKDSKVMEKLVLGAIYALLSYTTIEGYCKYEAKRKNEAPEKYIPRCLDTIENTFEDAVSEGASDTVQEFFEKFTILNPRSYSRTIREMVDEVAPNP